MSSKTVFALSTDADSGFANSTKRGFPIIENVDANCLGSEEEGKRITIDVSKLSLPVTSLSQCHHLGPLEVIGIQSRCPYTLQLALQSFERHLLHS